MIGYNNVKVKGAIEINVLKHIDISIIPSVHGKAEIIGIIKNDIADEQIIKKLENENIQLLELDDDGNEKRIPIFSGIIISVQIYKNNGYNEVIINALTGTYLLDLNKKSRSFQDVSMTYEDVVKEVLKDTDTACAICSIGEENKIGKPVIQYLESDWEFINRMASYLNGVVIPEMTFPIPRFWFGASNDLDEVIFDESDYTTGIDDNYFKLGGSEHRLNKADYFYYTVESEHNYQIGNKTNFKGKDLIICEKYVYMKKGEVIFKYKIGRKGILKKRQYFNEAITGMSILGEVIETSNETVKIHLDIDENQDTGTAYPYQWVPETGNMMYCMPKVGTRVSLYMSSANEQNAKAVNCIRTNGSTCKKLSYPNNRTLTSEHGKQMHLYPDSMGFSSNGADGEIDSAPIKMVMNDGSGLLLDSNKSINIVANEGIKFDAPEIEASSKIDIIMAQVGGEVTPESAANPKVTFDLCDDAEAFGENTKVEGTKKDSYKPFDDAPEKAEFNWKKLAGNVVAGVAICIIGAGFLAVVGGALVGIGAIAGSTLLGMEVGVAAGGLFTLASTAKGDYDDGDADDTNKYIYKSEGAVVGGVAGGAVSGIAGFYYEKQVETLLGYTISSAASNAIGNASTTATEKCLNDYLTHSYDVSKTDVATSFISGTLAGIPIGAGSKAMGTGAGKYIKSKAGQDIRNGTRETFGVSAIGDPVGDFAKSNITVNKDDVNYILKNSLGDYVDEW